jgi:predicted Fe-S protein YdhL (DUF1289 family)
MRGRHCLLLLTILVAVVVITLHQTHVFFLGHIWSKSQGCRGFYNWIRMVQQDINLTFITRGDMTETIGPHFILVNHVRALHTVGSLLALSGVVSSPCRAVCYRNYSSFMVPCIGNTMDSIMRDEIVIDRHMSNTEKEELMVAGIKDSFSNQKNVVMFIDSGGHNKPIRSIYKKVLEYFPDIPKHLFHIQTTHHSTMFSIRGYSPTYAVDDIVESRTKCMIGMFPS